MRAANLELALTVECAYCGERMQYCLPLPRGHGLNCRGCSRELRIDSDTLDRVDALDARFRAILRPSYTTPADVAITVVAA